MENQCTYCRSLDTIPWDTGYICRDCGNEFGTNSLPKSPWTIDEEEEE